MAIVKPISHGTLILMLNSAVAGTYLTAIEDRDYVVLSSVFVKTAEGSWKSLGAHTIGDQYHNDLAMAELINWNTVEWSLS